MAKMTTQIIMSDEYKTDIFKIPTKKLFLDIENPRLYGGKNPPKTEMELLRYLFLNSYLKELAESISEYSYLDEEPLIGAPKNLPKKFEKVGRSNPILWKEYEEFLMDPKTEITIVEGNRRLATIKLLLDKKLREDLNVKGWVEINDKIREDISEDVPVILYTYRKYIIPYLGIKHVAGPRKWGAYQKANFIISMKNGGYSIEEIRKIMGERVGSTEKYLISRRLVKLVEEEDEYAAELSKKKFSLLILMLGSGAYRDFLGMSKKIEKINLNQPIKKSKLRNLLELFSILFGDKNNPPAITDSRQISKELKFILMNRESTKELMKSRNIKLAYDLSEGEETSLIDKLNEIYRQLSSVLGNISKYKEKPLFLDLIRQIKDKIDLIIKIIGEK